MEEWKNGNPEARKPLPHFPTSSLPRFIASPLPVILALVLAFGLRLLGLGAKSLWLDEAASWDLARGTLGQIWAARYDPHPPLYYVLLHFWLRLGSSELLLRWPSTLAGVLAVALTYHLGRVWWGRAAGLGSALLLAISPLAVWYSQEARMYGLVVVFGLLSAAFLTNLLRGGRLGTGMGYVAFSLAGLYTHYSMLLVLVAEAIYVAAAILARRCRGRQARSWLLAEAAVAIGFLPWLPTALSHARAIGTGDLHPFIRLQQLASARGLTLPALPGLGAELLAGAIAFGLALILVSWLLARRRPLPATPVIASAVILYLLLTIASAVPLGTSLKRQALVAVPYLMVAVGATLGGRRSVRLGVALSLATLPALGAIYLQPKEQWREAAQLVEADARPEDVVLLHADYTMIPFGYYYRGPTPARPAPSTEAEVERLLQTHPRLWLVLSHQSYADPASQMRSWLERHATPIGRATLVGIEVRLYQRQ